jgi:hypothetical protein
MLIRWRIDIDWGWVVRNSLLVLANISALMAMCLLVGCSSSSSKKDKPRPIPVIQVPACLPEDRCDGDPNQVMPLEETETILALTEVRDWFRARLEAGEFAQRPIDWNALPPVKWVPNWFYTKAGWAAGVTTKDFIQISTVQLWRRRGLLRHESCHWWYRKLTGDPDPEHKQQYLN